MIDRNKQTKKAFTPKGDDSDGTLKKERQINSEQRAQFKGGSSDYGPTFIFDKVKILSLSPFLFMSYGVE